MNTLLCLQREFLTITYQHGILTIWQWFISQRGSYLQYAGRSGRRLALEASVDDRAFQQLFAQQRIVISSRYTDRSYCLSSSPHDARLFVGQRWTCLVV